MHTSLVLMVCGADRPGIVERIAQVVLAEEGNWVEARMARLAGRFAGVLSVTVPDSRVASLRRALEELPRDGLNIVIDDADDSEGGATDGQPLLLELTGSDREGIVKEVTAVLAGLRVNVEEIVTGRREAPMAGGMLFDVRAQIRCPPDVEVHRLRSALEGLSSELAVDITVGPIKAAND